MTADSQVTAVVQRIQTTQTDPWRSIDHVKGLMTTADRTSIPDVIVAVDRPEQMIEGFGACFNELGWTSLSVLTDAEREGVLRELFAPGDGANLSLCRMPIGANDFSRDWYSYDETPGDLALEHFDIGNDLETLIPFIHAARRQQPDLRLWASPWSPPTWMKANQHYAGAPASPSLGIDNGLRSDQVGEEGTDMAVIDDAHLSAYAKYFGRFIDAYRDQGIEIRMVMPQNEFNSPQVFPSCTWTPDGLREFLRHLGPEMREREVEVFLGTLERKDDRLVGEVLKDREVGHYISGAGVQWEGKGAIAALHRLYPNLRIYQTEQECGDGRNDWRHARHAWNLMKRFLSNGANAYTYWNISLLEGGVSRWGWTQNSLVVVDPQSGTHRYTHEYHLLKHVSAFVQTGARYLDTISLNGFDNQLAFLNPDGSVIIVIQNDLGEDIRVTIGVGSVRLTPILPADSFTTFVLPSDPTSGLA